MWFVILAVWLLVLIIWWFNRRKSDGAVVPPEAPVQLQRETPPDDLVRLEGIGPKVAKVLNDVGITTFDALAGADPADLQKTLNAAGLQMMNPEGWIEQARLAAKGDWDGVERLQGELRGGRKK